MLFGNEVNNMVIGGNNFMVNFINNNMLLNEVKFNMSNLIVMI